MSLLVLLQLSSPFSVAAVAVSLEIAHVDTVILLIVPIGCER